MHPELVTGRGSSGGNDTLQVYGKMPYTTDADTDVLPRNVIRPYHDMFLVKAAMAYVDDDGTFCMYDINYDNDIFNRGASLPTANKTDGDNKPVYRVEGIKAVRFLPELGTDNRVTGVNVRVLAEGDNAVTGRRTDTQAVRDLRNRWPDISARDWDDDMYYEDFEMRWRTRNVEAPTP
jgi:hypothetical protein